MMLNVFFFFLFAVITFSACSKRPTESDITEPNQTPEAEIQYSEDVPFTEKRSNDPADEVGDMELTEEDLIRLNSGPEEDL